MAAQLASEENWRCFKKLDDSQSKQMKVSSVSHAPLSELS